VQLLSRPVPLAVFGASCIAFSAPLVALSHANAATASVFRCLLAVPLLSGLAAREARGGRPRCRRTRLLAFAAGALLGGDLLLWSQAIGEVGAGVSTVVVNVQVLLVPLLALAIDREPLTRRFGVAVVPMLVGVAMAAGVGVQALGSDPPLGTAHAVLAAGCYAGYLSLLRRGATVGRPLAALRDITLTAGAVSLVAGALWQGIDLAPSWAAFGWLLALAISGQVLGWLALATALPRLSARVGSSLLLLQPVGAVLLGILLLSQTPAAIQLGGCVLVLIAVAVATMHDRDAETP